VTERYEVPQVAGPRSGMQRPAHNGQTAGYGPRAAHDGPRASQLPSESNATRLLCAGVQLDPKFCGEVIEELVKQGHRRTAPAYGYDCVRVLAYALNARRRRRIRNIAMLACLLPLTLSAIDAAGLDVRWAAEHGIQWAGGLSVQWFLLAIWWIWAVLVVERVVTTHILVSRLKRTPGSTHDTRLPQHKVLDQRARKIILEQGQVPVFYSGQVPFVGAGTLSRSWSFSVVLRAANASAPLGKFTPEELAGHVCHQVVDRLKTRVAPAERISGLNATVRHYGTLLRPSGFDASTASQDDPGNSAGSAENYYSSRKYACISISSWDQELVTSIFVGFDIRGDTLHTELYSYVLLPIKAEYHEVDRLPEVLSVPEVLAIAATSPLKAMSDLFRMVARIAKEFAPARSKSTSRTSVLLSIGFFQFFLPWILFSLFIIFDISVERMLLYVSGFAAVWLAPAVAGPLWRRHRRRAVERDADRQRANRELAGSSGRAIVDYGARTSIRELAASEDPHHFFQSVDQDKYTKIIERRVTDFIIDFLRVRNVDVSEFETRQQVVLNYGIMQTGGGQIINSGSMAAGMSMATTTSTGP